MQLFKLYLTEPPEAAVKSLVALPNSINNGHERSFRTYAKLVPFHLKQYSTDDNISNFGNEIRTVREGKLTLTVFAQQLLSKTLTCGFVYNEKTHKEMFVELEGKKVSI